MARRGWNSGCTFVDGSGNYFPIGPRLVAVATVDEPLASP